MYNFHAKFDTVLSSLDAFEMRLSIFQTKMSSFRNKIEAPEKTLEKKLVQGKSMIILETFFIIHLSR